MRYQRSAIAATILLAAGIALPLQSAPAETGGASVKLEGFAGAAQDERPLGDRETDFSGGVLPSVSFDLGQAVVQIDGMGASHNGEGVWATAGHLGFKPNDRLSLGAYAAYAHHKYLSLDNYRVGAEAVYRGAKVTLAGVAGYENTERRSVVVGTIPGFTVTDTYGRGGDFFSMVDATFYPDENFSLSAGHRYIGGRHAATLGAEKSFGVVSLFAEGRAGDGGYAAAWGGLRVRFGRGSESLQASDNSGFLNRLKDELFGSSNTRERNRAGVVTPPVVVPTGEPTSVPTGSATSSPT